jgi:hypothetical protein
MHETAQLSLCPQSMSIGNSNVFIKEDVRPDPELEYIDCIDLRVMQSIYSCSDT